MTICALRSRKRAYDRNRYLKRKERRVVGEASTQVEEDSTPVVSGLQSAAGVDRRVGPRRGGTFSSYHSSARGNRENVNVAHPPVVLPSTQLLDQPLISVEVTARIAWPELRSAQVPNMVYFIFAVSLEAKAQKNEFTICEVVPATEKEERRILGAKSKQYVTDTE